MAGATSAAPIPIGRRCACPTWASLLSRLAPRLKHPNYVGCRSLRPRYAHFLGIVGQAIPGRPPLSGHLNAARSVPQLPPLYSARFALLRAENRSIHPLGDASIGKLAAWRRSAGPEGEPCDKDTQKESSVKTLFIASYGILKAVLVGLLAMWLPLAHAAHAAAAALPLPSVEECLQLLASMDIPWEQKVQAVQAEPIVALPLLPILAALPVVLRAAADAPLSWFARLLGRQQQQRVELSGIGLRPAAPGVTKELPRAVSRARAVTASYAAAMRVAAEKAVGEPQEGVSEAGTTDGIAVAAGAAEEAQELLSQPAITGGGGVGGEGRQEMEVAMVTTQGPTASKECGQPALKQSLPGSTVTEPSTDYWQLNERITEERERMRLRLAKLVTASEAAAAALAAAQDSRQAGGKGGGQVVMASVVQGEEEPPHTQGDTQVAAAAAAGQHCGALQPLGSQVEPGPPGAGTSAAHHKGDAVVAEQHRNEEEPGSLARDAGAPAQPPSMESLNPDDRLEGNPAVPLLSLVAFGVSFSKAVEAALGAPCGHRTASGSQIPSPQSSSSATASIRGRTDTIEAEQGPSDMEFHKRGGGAGEGSTGLSTDRKQAPAQHKELPGSEHQLPMLSAEGRTAQEASTSSITGSGCACRSLPADMGEGPQLGDGQRPDQQRVCSNEVGYIPARMGAVQSHFPAAVGMDDFLFRVEMLLGGHGFYGNNSIAVANMCCEGITCGLKYKIKQAFPLVFNINGLGGVITCGLTGIGAGLSHSPKSVGGKERYVFFSFPHIGINSRGEVDAVTRPWQPGAPPSACGALIAVLGELTAEGLKANSPCEAVHTAKDPEFSILKQCIAKRMLQEEREPADVGLVEATKMAERQITADLEALIEKVVDPRKADYAIVTGVQIHNWGLACGNEEPNLEFVSPTSIGVVVDGKRTDLNVSCMPSPTPRQLWKLGCAGKRSSMHSSSNVVVYTGSSTVTEVNGAMMLNGNHDAEERSQKFANMLAKVEHEGPCN
mmetsp:Transcript_7991/g.22905  ORF Transcript_7991/g.22905 Transcript_7991/m.22905 type:complete len:1007 (-) Transcript_7991:160-3180(-)|eukprot:CAMPEP_0117662138 /NCGR_PEP_ID=MMETSP0804-20121206/7899_1 /TAXON_ID=1074897 /ORGANISM="Tetraselmis astigmatica, Strain CCMP880" /LENGTH=1006 /DNA_ID=CAMNT_0005469029 /DNA_START=73 /DNA_END=3093 /DNA_ORIENTATION=-